MCVCRCVGYQQTPITNKQTKQKTISKFELNHAIWTNNDNDSKLTAEQKNLK